METNKHTHHDVMIALADNPHLVVECRSANTDWEICEYPVFSPDFQYRIQREITDPEHYELLRLFANNAALQFQRNIGGDWVDVQSSQIKWGSGLAYRVKQKDFRIGDIVRSSNTGMVLVVTGPVVGDSGFSGTVLLGDAYTDIGITHHHWDEDCFELIDNPFLELK